MDPELAGQVCSLARNSAKPLRNFPSVILSFIFKTMPHHCAIVVVHDAIVEFLTNLLICHQLFQL